MTSGSAGMTRKTLVIVDRTSSQIPPRKALSRPMATAMIMAMAEATKPTMSETLVPSTSWAKTFCPVSVVPRGYCADGGA